MPFDLILNLVYYLCLLWGILGAKYVLVQVPRLLGALRSIAHLSRKSLHSSSYFSLLYLAMNVI
jgi:hypothetical protein